MIGGKNNQGITLLEILIAISLFAIVLIAAIGLFASLIKNQQAVLDRAYVLNSLSYATEYMSKSLRMAQKDIVGSCISSGENFVLTGQANIKFLNHNNECQEFFLENKTLKVKKLGATQDLTPQNIIVESLNFVLSGEDQYDEFQPKVSFSLRAKVATSTAASLLTQTTVSQRMLDISY